MACAITSKEYEPKLILQLILFQLKKHNYILYDIYNCFLE